ncbi:MAG: hypothetical protein ABIK83_01950 [Candidatus Zixiibacteriota bacterium]
MAKNSAFDISEEQAGELVLGNVEKMLAKSKSGHQIRLGGVRVRFNPETNSYSKTIEYTILSEEKNGQPILSDNITETYALRKGTTLTQHLEDSKASLTAYHIDLMLSVASRATKAYRMYREHREEVLIPILVRVIS